MEVEKLDVYKASYEAPTPDFIDKLWDDLPQLEQDDPDAYAVACGLMDLGDMTVMLFFFNFCFRYLRLFC